MEKHFTVQVVIEEVLHAHPIEDSRGNVVKQGPSGAPVMQDRQVIDRLRVVVSAEDDQEAVQRAINMLTAARD